MTAQKDRELRKAQMAAAAGRRAEPDARPAGRTAIRSKPVRITLDLSPELYRELNVWADEAAIALGVPRVSLADAVRAMIRVTADHPDQVLDRLRRDRDKYRRGFRRTGSCRAPAASRVRELAPGSQRERRGPARGSAPARPGRSCAAGPRAR